MKFYIYENWRAERAGKAKIHKSFCSHCNNGNGKQKEKGNNNGKWHGPFDSFDSAMKKAKNEMNNRNISICKICVPINEKEGYKKNLKEAAQDDEFIKRTLNAQEDFKFVDCESIEER